MKTVQFGNLNELINDIYIPAFTFTGRFLVLFGGSGSGKSWAIAQKIIYRMITENDHNILCVRATGNTLHRSSFALLKATIINWGCYDLFTINQAEGKEKITCKQNGNQIIFSGLDDVEKLKSIYNITSVWIEEASEVQQEDFRELNRRLRGYEGLNKNGTVKYMQFMISFNPISQLHWLKKRFYDITNKLLIWDAAQAKLMTDTSTCKTLVIHSTYLDNRWIDEAYRDEMEELKAESEYEYNVYALGLWGITGNNYFDGEKLDKRILEIQQLRPLKIGYFEYQTYFNSMENEVLIKDESIKWIDDKRNGYIRIYEDVQSGFPYILSGDTAGEGSDWNTGSCINNVTGHQIASLRLNFDEDLYARQMYCLGTYYNTAMIAVETNFSTHPMKVLTQLSYRNQYIREERPDAFTGTLSKIFGFNTNKSTRPDMLGKLRTVVRDYIEYINDLETLTEMTTFIINEKGRPEAAEGKDIHDDCIMALAIGYQVRDQMTMKVKRSKKDKSIIELDKERLAKQFKKNQQGKGKVLS